MAPGRFFPLLLLLLPAAASIDARPGPNGPPLLELCSLPKVVGRCRASMPRWWFNVTLGSCQSFVFGGCEGNANNFPTEQECRESCVLGGASRKTEHHSKQTDSTYDESCTVPRVTGPCRASFLRWYYNPANRTCHQFIYGGCRGNKNNYENEEECLNRCVIKPENPGDDFHRDFLSTKALALGVLLAVLAAILLGYVTDVTIKTCRKRPEMPGTGMGWSPSDDKEYLMSNAYTL
ncbi:putative Kunitz-type serine protease inhibitor [Balearica regulorum gibbericeps]|uniref:putative Kunitz-type serine protease inhibitor n=1 Tax=Balearica regulorum gibbericeps TaxID=100784 RepID=UPI003F60A161